MLKREIPWRGVASAPHTLYYFSVCRLVAITCIIGTLLSPLISHAQADTIPPYVTSVTIVTTASDSTLGSPNNASIITLRVATISDLKKAHVTVCDSTDAVLFAQEYDINRIAVYSMSGGYKLTLKFFTQLDLGAHTVKVRFEDKDDNMGTAFTVGD